MSIDDDIAFLERVPTLSLLGRQALRILAIGAESRYVHGGEVLFNAGDAADGGFVIQEGRFNLASAEDGRELTVGPGTLLGEVALFAETRRPATATALEPSTVLCIPRQLFSGCWTASPTRRANSARSWRRAWINRCVKSSMCARCSTRRNRSDRTPDPHLSCAGSDPRIQRSLQRAWFAGAEPGNDAGVRRPHTSSVAVTGTWSDGRNQPREWRSTRMSLTRSASAGATQMWSSRRPLSAVCQSGER